jgi:hypothetical protein
VTDLLAPIERAKIEANERAQRARARIADASEPPALIKIFDLQAPMAAATPVIDGNARRSR